MYNYRNEIDELRAVERNDSNEFIVQAALVGICVLLAFVMVGLWQVVIWYVLVYGLSIIERYLHRRRQQQYSRRLHIFYIALGTTIACISSLLPVFLWTFDDRIYHFAAAIYMIGAVLNTFVLRAQAWPTLLCYAIPNGLALIFVAITFLTQDGLSAKTFIGLALGGVITCYLIIMVQESVRRVEAKRQITKDLLQAQKSETVANFAGGVAHDFNNLLGIILASLEQARDEKDVSERKALVDQAIAAVGRGSGLTKQLLAVGRRTELENQKIDMQSFTEELRHFLKRVIPSSINLQVKCDPSLSIVDSEPTLLQSMLLNLAMNARDAMADVGSLKIRIYRTDITQCEDVSAGRLLPGTYATFCVEDDGKGIEPDVFGRVLEPFFSTRPQGEGTGLGLAMVLGFSQQVGGALDIESQEGKGTVVRFFLPITQHSLGPLKNKQKDIFFEQEGNRSTQKILLVEDEAPLREMIGRYLTMKGHSVVSCEDGDSAFKSVRDGYEADTVLTDLVMPGIRQGSHLLSDLRELLPEATMILMTGYAFNHDTSALSSSDDSNSHILQKPFKFSELEHLLHGEQPAPNPKSEMGVEMAAS